jgi:hypothetical protein
MQASSAKTGGSTTYTTQKRIQIHVIQILKQTEEKKLFSNTSMSAMTAVCDKFRSNLSNSQKRCLVDESLWDKLPFKWTKLVQNICLYVYVATGPNWTTASSYTRFLDHTQRGATVGRTPLDEWSASPRDLWQHTQHSQQKNPRPRRDSNPQSQQTSGRRPTP